MDRPVRPPVGSGPGTGTNPFPPVREVRIPGRQAPRPDSSGRGANDLFPSDRSVRPGGSGPGTNRPGGSRPGGGGGGNGGPTHGPRGPQGRGGPPGRTGPRLIDYPRYGKTGIKHWIPSWKLVLSLFLLLLVSMGVAFSVAYASTDIPAADSMVSAQTTTIKFSGGDKAPELGKLSVQNRKSVSTIPQVMQDAMISAEDRSFRTNSGVSPSAIVRAAWNNFRGGSTQGGSTITQQYVKNSFEMKDRTLSRKAKEFFIALKINRTMKKDDILRDYLNTIYFGRGAYGVEAASQTYFGKPVADINSSQAAYLALVVKGPVNYDPVNGEPSTSRAKARWNYVVDGMVATGAISSADRTKMAFPAVLPKKKANTNAGYTGYLMQMVTDEAEKVYGLDEGALERGGFTITTTFDKRLMEQAAKSIKEELPKKKDIPSGTEVGMATVNPASGAVMSIYGGPDAIVHPFNNATQATMQAGSTFKPFTLIAALKQGIGLKSRYSGKSPQTVGGFEFENFGNSSYSQMDLLTATAKSVNTVYAQLNEAVTPEATVKIAEAAGVPKDTQDLIPNLANVLGTASPTVLDMASAYATIAAQGVYHKPFVIGEIKNPDGSPLYKHQSAPSRAFDADVAADATYAMQQVVKRGSGTYAQALDREVAGKTGTSSSNRSAWFNAFTPQMVTTVGMYRHDGPKQVDLEGFGDFNEITGNTFPVRIWTNFMEAALDGADKVDFPDPAYVGETINPEPVHTYTPSTDSSSSSTRTDEPTQSQSEQPTQTEEPTDDPTEDQGGGLGGIIGQLPGQGGGGLGGGKGNGQ